MNKICLTVMLLLAGVFPARAQRLDGCPERYDPVSSVATPSGITLDQGLRSAGFDLTRGVLTIALRDPRPDVRSLAALKLSLGGTKIDASQLLQAWLVEKDACTKVLMRVSLSNIVGDLAWDPAQHPGGQQWIAPFETCTVPPSPLVTLGVEQETKYLNPTPTVRITARNETPLPVLFAWAREPGMLFSVTVTDPTGAPAKISKQIEWKYQPVHDLSGTSGHTPFGVMLMPQEAPTWVWRVGDDFDMSAPGIYHVSLGGRLGYLDTTVCSNTAEVKVGN